MTITAEQARGLLDYHPAQGGDLDQPMVVCGSDAHSMGYRPAWPCQAADLAATVIELYERLGSQTEQSSALQSEVDGLRSRLASVEAERDAAVAESVIERDATTHIVYEHSQQSIEMTSLRSELERLRTNFAESVEQNMNATTERATMVAAHRAREGRLNDAEKVAAQSVAKLKTLGYRLDAVRQELTARAEKAEAERDELLDQVLTVQTSSAYDLGHQHGEATGGKWKRERDEWCRIYAQAETERNAFEAAIDKVLALHIREWITHDGIDGVEGCDVCGAGWPCDTRVALTQGGEPK